MNRAFRHLSRLAMALGAVCAATLFWGFFVERPYLTYQHLPWVPAVLQVRVGEVIPLMVRRCNSSTTTQTYIVSRELRPEDKRKPVLLMTTQLASIPPGCHESVSRLHTIPLDASPGYYRVHGLGVMRGTLRTFELPWSSLPFEVIQ